MAESPRTELGSIVRRVGNGAIALIVRAAIGAFHVLADT
jgi:hypothetical protein